MSIKANIIKDPRIDLKARRALNGNIMIFDHEDIDIVLSEDGSKCVTFPKEEMSDRVYSAQDRMFNFLAKRGIIEKSSIKGGNIYGSLEAVMLTSKIPEVDTLQACLYTIHEYLTGERPYFRRSDKFDDSRLDYLLRPEPDDSTDLGDVPQSDKKGSMDSRVRPYGFMYNYSLIREEENKEG